MTLFVIFVLGAVLIGTGAMLAPALPTEQTRVGVSTSLTLIFIVTGGIIWTQFVQWDTLVIDYLMFGVVSLVVLGGTMMQAQHSKDGEKPVDTVQWISLSDIAFIAVLGLLCVLALWTPLFPQTLETIAIPTSEAIRELPSFGIKAHEILGAYLAQQLQQDSVLVQQAIVIVTVFLCVFTTYDLGAEIKNAYLGRTLAVGALIILWGLLYFLPELHLFLMSFLLHLAQVVFMVRTLKYRQWLDLVVFLVLFAIVFLL